MRNNAHRLQRIKEKMGTPRLGDLIKILHGGRDRAKTLSTMTPIERAQFRLKEVNKRIEETGLTWESRAKMKPGSLEERVTRGVLEERDLLIKQLEQVQHEDLNDA